MRGNLGDCEVDMASINDLWNEIRRIGVETKAPSITMDCYQLLSCCLVLLKIITAMLSTFARYSRSRGPKLLLEEAEQLKRELDQHARNLADWNKDITVPVSCHAKLVHQYLG